MKKLLLLGGWLLLAQAGRAAALPADTVQGQAHFVRQLSSSLCTRLLDESKKTDLNAMSPEDTEKFFAKLMFGALADNVDGFQAIMAKAGQGRAQELGKEMGQDAVLQLVDVCPDSRALLARMGAKTMKKEVEMTAAERPVLTPIAQTICRRLDEENAKQPYDKMTPAARSAAMQKVMQASIVASVQDLSDYYGEDVTDDEKQMEQVGTKIGYIVFEQCPSYIMMLGRDAQRQAAAPAAAAKAAPAPRKAASARRPATRQPTKK